MSISLETMTNEGGGPCSLADSNSFQKTRLNYFITDSPAKELTKTHKPTRRTQAQLSFDNRVELPGRRLLCWYLP